MAPRYIAHKPEYFLDWLNNNLFLYPATIYYIYYIYLLFILQFHRHTCSKHSIRLTLAQNVSHPNLSVLIMYLKLSGSLSDLPELCTLRINLELKLTS